MLKSPVARLFLFRYRQTTLYFEIRLSSKRTFAAFPLVVLAEQALPKRDFALVVSR